MSQRWSEYKRQDNDLYETPEWVTLALLPHLPDDILSAWEPACGSGKMLSVLEKHISKVMGTDISSGWDFLTHKAVHVEAIITNPPYKLAQQFIERALEYASFVAMLLRTDFDHAKTRAHLFGHNKTFAKKIVLTKRIKWFEDSKGSPSVNHAWFIWNIKHEGPPTIAYAP